MTEFKQTAQALTRRAFLGGICSTGAALGVSGCATTSGPGASIAPSIPSRQIVDYGTREPAGTIVVDPPSHYLYHVQGNGRAVRYRIAVGMEGSTWSGSAYVRSKQEWPDWYPTREMLERRPDIIPMLKPLRGGQGYPGGPTNPLGARALYLWQGNKDTLYRIHGTNQPETMGQDVTSGCIRMVNEDVIDLYDRTPVGTRVVVLPGRGAGV